MMYSHHLGCHSSGLVSYSDVRIPRFGNSPEDEFRLFTWSGIRKTFRRKAFRRFAISRKTNYAIT